jgi:predicted nuclease with TOPRIM domain
MPTLRSLLLLMPLKSSRLETLRTLNPEVEEAEVEEAEVEEVEAEVEEVEAEVEEVEVEEVEVEVVVVMVVVVVVGAATTAAQDGVIRTFSTAGKFSGLFLLDNALTMSSW